MLKEKENKTQWEKDYSTGPDNSMKNLFITVIIAILLSVILSFIFGVGIGVNGLGIIIIYLIVKYFRNKKG